MRLLLPKTRENMSKYRYVGNSLMFDVEDFGRKRTILIPGYEDCDGAQLDELIHWQVEQTRDQLRQLGEKVEPRYSRKEIGKAVNEWYLSQKRRKETMNQRYHPGYGGQECSR